MEALHILTSQLRKKSALKFDTKTNVRKEEELLPCDHMRRRRTVFSLDYKNVRHCSGRKVTGLV